MPSSLDLIGIQDDLATAPAGKFHSVIPTELLWRAVKARLDDYDLVIVDCPPNLGIITLNGLRISQGYIIPTIPDFLSTYGIPQIVTRVREFSEEIAEPIVEMSANRAQKGDAFREDVRTETGLGQSDARSAAGQGTD